MEGYVLPTTAKLVTLADIKSRFFVTNLGVLCLRFDLGPRANGDVGLVRLDGSWQAEAIGATRARQHSRYIEVEGTVPHVNAKSMEWKMTDLADVGCLVLDENGIWIVAKHYDQTAEKLLVNFVTGARAWTGTDYASVITSWAVDASVGDLKTFEIGAHTVPPLIPADV